MDARSKTICTWQRVSWRLFLDLGFQALLPANYIVSMSFPMDSLLLTLQPGEQRERYTVCDKGLRTHKPCLEGDDIGRALWLRVKHHLRGKLGFFGLRSEGC